MIYLASLYSLGAKTDSDLHKEVRASRYEYTLKRLTGFVQEGYYVFSPIVHSHPMATKYGLPKDYQFYKKNDRHFVSKSDEVWVLQMTDDLGCWTESVGISDEIQFAIDNGKPVKYIECPDYK